MSDQAPAETSRLSRLLQIALAFFGILGGIVTVVQIWQWWAPSDETTVVWSMNEDVVFKRQKDFDVTVSMPHAALNENDIIRSDITLFRAGGKPITGDQLRRPLSIHLPSGAFLLGRTIEGVQNAPEDNFQIAFSPLNDRVDVSWKFFDPDMAIKFAILRQGSQAPLTITQNLGPGINAERFTVPISKQLLLSVVALLSMAVWAALLLGVLRMGFAFIEATCPVPWRSAAVVLLLVCELAALVSWSANHPDLLFFAAQWLAPHIQTPTPFS